MSYHGYSSSRTPSSPSSAQAESSQRQAPPGFHYMPNGALMADSDMVGQTGNDSATIISAFDLDLSDIPAEGESRAFEIIGGSEVEFRLEVKDNTTGYYYNFATNLFQAKQAFLNESISGTSYSGSILFPSVTGSDDQYDVFLFASPNSRHASYIEARFSDGSLDINNSIGSNSLLMQKVIYQYTALTLTLQGYSVGSALAGTFGTDAITINRGKSSKSSFSFTTTAAATAAYRVLKSVAASDILSFVSPTIGSAPVVLPGENIYPTATAAFTGDDINGAVTSGAVVRMDNTDLSAVIKVGDKITTPVVTDTVDGAVSSGIKVVMDNNVALKMAVGDQVTGNAYLNANVVTVAALNPDEDNAKEFSLSEAVAISDGITLTFSSKINRSLTTVTVVETSSTATDFTMSQAINFRDNCPLTFFNQMNYRWPINNFANILKRGMSVEQGTNTTANTTISDYRDTTVIQQGTVSEEYIVKNYKEAVSTLGKFTRVVKGLVTVQTGNVVFSNQQALALAGDQINIGGFGENQIFNLYGWDVKFTNLKISLKKPTTTTTEATAAHAVIAVADREGVINNFSTVGGIGIDSSVKNPTITAGGGADGAGDWNMNAVQTLENGTTLTVENTSRVAIITGSIEIIKAGTSSQTIRFDINKLLSTSA